MKVPTPTPTVSARRTRYELLDTIASGGMARVYLGRAQRGGKSDANPVAVKILHPHLIDDPDAVALFLDEARLATRIVHPNVVSVRDVDMVGNDLVIVMEYVEGLALSGLLKVVRERGEQLPIPIVVRILIDTLRGLHAAHEIVGDDGLPMKIVHRDVSPHNIIVGADGSVRVTDFGVATSVGRLAQTRTDGVVRGKLQYLAPEQIHRKPPERRVDVWASGTVLWECLVGQRLFSGGTEAETIADILRAPIAPPSTARPEVGLALDDICLRALERDPARRFESAAAFADALERESEVTPAKAEDIAKLVEGAAGSTFAKRRDVLERGPSEPVVLPERFAAAAPNTPPPSSRPTPARTSGLLLVAVALVSLVAGGLIVRFTSMRQAPASATSSAPATPLSPSALAAADPIETAEDGGAILELPASSTTPAAARVTSGGGRPRQPEKRRGSGARPATSGSRPFMPADL